jgi:hypothetical protein
VREGLRTHGLRRGPHAFARSAGCVIQRTSETQHVASRRIKSKTNLS